MKHILLSQGTSTIVDDEDYNRLRKYKWFSQKSASGFYATRWHGFKGLYDTNPQRLGRIKRIRINMARQIVGLCCDDPQVVDHINHDTLDNRRINLRICTRQENTWNKKGKKGGQSQYKGIWKNRRNVWQVAIGRKYAGCSRSEVEAAKMYDVAAEEKYGEYAYLNFPQHP